MIKLNRDVNWGLTEIGSGLLTPFGREEAKNETGGTVSPLRPECSQCDFAFPRWRPSWSRGSLVFYWWIFLLTCAVRVETGGNLHGERVRRVFVNNDWMKSWNSLKNLRVHVVPTDSLIRPLIVTNLVRAYSEQLIARQTLANNINRQLYKSNYCYVELLSWDVGTKTQPASTTFRVLCSVPCVPQENDGDLASGISLPSRGARGRQGLVLLENCTGAHEPSETLLFRTRLTAADRAMVSSRDFGRIVWPTLNISWGEPFLHGIYWHLTWHLPRWNLSRWKL